MKKLFVLVVLLFLATVSILAEPPSWPGWRGPNGDGVSAETDWNPRCLEGRAKILWTADIGAGYSNIATSNGRLYASGSGDATHLAFCCIDAATGRALWKVNLPVGIGGRDPLSTPAMDGDRVYGMAQNGALFCLGTMDGRLIWQKQIGTNAEDDVKSFPVQYFAFSPVVDGPRLLLNVNIAGVAPDKMTGRVIWDSGTNIANPLAPSGQVYSTPRVIDLEGRRTVVFLGPSALSAVDAATGKALWSIEHGEGIEVVADPVIEGTTIFFSTSSRCTVMESQLPRGLMSIFKRQTSPRVLWSNDSLRGVIATPVLINGYLYGSDWDRYVDSWNWQPVQKDLWNFRCVDVKTGKIAWTRSTNWVSLVAANGKLVMLDPNGTLTVAEASPKGYTELSRADVLAGANKPRLFVTAPVLCDGRIYVRNYAGDLICIDARK